MKKTPAPSKRYFPFAVLALVLLGLGGYFAWGTLDKQAGTSRSADGSGEKVKLVYAVHWSEKAQLDGLQVYLDEYTKLHPNISFEVRTIPYNEYADKLAVMSKAGLAPDIYQIYSPWGVSYVREGLLDAPPADVLADVSENYVSTTGVTIDGKIWGIPTEINDFSLLYNKKLFAEAGLTYPKTWNDLTLKASKLTKKDARGIITQYGIAFLKGSDWQVVDPFLSLLFSNGGKYLSDDGTKALFNSPEGVLALDATTALFKNKVTDLNGNFFDFGKGTVAMVIAPPWTKGAFKTAFGDAFEETVGVAPFPYLIEPATLQYSWFMGVMAGSQHKQVAWDFLRWFTMEPKSGSRGVTRYGDLMANTIGAIPSRKVDFEAHEEVLGDFFTKVYVDQMQYGVAEPNVLNASKIKSTLMAEIEAAWAGRKTSKQALDDAARAIDKILATGAVKP